MNNTNENPDHPNHVNPPKVYRRDLSKMTTSANASNNITPENTFENFIKTILDFNGTAGVMEYLLYSFAILGLMIIPGIIFIVIGLEDLAYKWIVIIQIITFLPMLAVTIRRLHDTGKSGMFILVSLIPVAGGLILLIMLLLPGDPTMNNPYRGSKL